MVCEVEPSTVRVKEPVVEAMPVPVRGMVAGELGSELVRVRVLVLLAGLMWEVQVVAVSAKV